MTPLNDYKKLAQESLDKANAATEGPWNYEPERYSAFCVIGIKPVDDRWIAHCQPEFNGQHNGRFIAHARQAVPSLANAVLELCQRVESQQATIDKLVKALELIGRGEKKLDKRKNYMIIDGKVCESIQWTDRCSGCSDGYGQSGGCNECGYTGKVRQGMWHPL